MKRHQLGYEFPFQKSNGQLRRRRKLFSRKRYIFKIKEKKVGELID